MIGDAAELYCMSKNNNFINGAMLFFVSNTYIILEYYNCSMFDCFFVGHLFTEPFAIHLFCSDFSG